MTGNLRSKDMIEKVNLGKWSLDKLEQIVDKTCQINHSGRKIDFISRQFLGTRYTEETLIGNETIREIFVINLSGVDCFTFLDYVEALRLSDSFFGFKNNLIHLRYRSGIIAFDHRNHFFSDWSVFNQNRVEDVTVRVGGRYTRSTKKILNVKEDGSLYLPGIAPVERTLDYIPANSPNESIFQKLKTGDYVGIYTDNPGLDVTHVGIIIKNKSTVYLRHASSLPQLRKVVDQDFKAYMTDRAGFLVLRPKKVEIASKE